jgi:hypothetical protein
MLLSIAAIPEALDRSIDHSARRLTKFFDHSPASSLRSVYVLGLLMALALPYFSALPSVGGAGGSPDFPPRHV